MFPDIAYEMQGLRTLVELLDGDDWAAAIERLTYAIERMTPDAVRAQLFIAVTTLSAVLRGNVDPSTQT